MSIVFKGDQIMSVYRGNQWSETIHGPFFVEYLIVAGGGTGARDLGTPQQAGGGGAGGYAAGKAVLQFNTSYSTLVGEGGASYDSPPDKVGNDGGNSELFGIVMIGGGGGGRRLVAGRPGGSGGGNNGIGTVGQGFNGGDDNGGGGGAGSAGFDSSNSYNGGIGKVWLDGVTYAIGGPGNRSAQAAPSLDSRGSGGKGSGTSGQPVPRGAHGIIKIRYFGSPRATGGTITEVGGYTYHTFDIGTSSFVTPSD